MNADPVQFGDLAGSDLTIDRTYRGGVLGTSADDPLARLLPVGNQGGFRYAGSPAKGTVKLCVLTHQEPNPTGRTGWTSARGTSPTSATTGDPGASCWRRAGGEICSCKTLSPGPTQGTRNG